MSGNHFLQPACVVQYHDLGRITERHMVHRVRLFRSQRIGLATILSGKFLTGKLRQRFGLQRVGQSQGCLPHRLAGEHRLPRCCGRAGIRRYISVRLMHQDL